jgi:glycosyltransferase involved in cell wall biosynthesis
MKILSIISPVYNGANFLPAFIEHLKNFTFKDFELIFVDNNSIDNSIEVLEQLLSNSEFEYKILTESIQGSGFARNKGLKNASGKYITFIDCDDSIDYRKLETDIQLLEDNEVDFVLCRTERKYTDGRKMIQPLKGIEEGILEPPLLGIVWLKNFFYLQGPGAILAKKEVFDDLGGFHTLKTGQDTFLYIKLGLTYRGYFYNKVFNFYWRHSESTISKRNKQENATLLSYFELRKNLFQDDIVSKNVEAKGILKKQLNSDILRLHNKKIKLSNLIDDKKLEGFKLNLILFNPISLLINKKISDIKYNPFYQLWLKTR